MVYSESDIKRLYADFLGHIAIEVVKPEHPIMWSTHMEESIATSEGRRVVRVEAQFTISDKWPDGKPA